MQHSFNLEINFFTTKLKEFYDQHLYKQASLIAQLVKNLPAMWEMWVRSLGWEDPLEKGKGYPLQYSGLENSIDCPWGRKELDTTERLSLTFTM